MGNFFAHATTIFYCWRRQDQKLHPWLGHGMSTNVDKTYCWRAVSNV